MATPSKIERQRRDNIVLPLEKLEKVKVTLTSYYTPKPGQEKYILGSYKGDRRMNGSGKGITATGKLVKKGMVAADPKDFPYGTILFSEEGEKLVVEDTGSALKRKSKKALPKIDIYVGEGDEGRRKAEKIGRREVSFFVLKRD